MTKNSLRKLYTFFATYFCLMCFSYNAISAPTIKEEKGNIYVSNISVAELEKLYEEHDYTSYLRINTKKFPPIFLSEMPYDFDEIEDPNQRNRLFLQIMIPLALKVNEDIILERGEVVGMLEYFDNNQNLSETQKARLEELAKKYDIFSRLKGLRRYPLLLNKLIEKVDIIPPSLAVATAAIETNWGTAKHLKKANSLYKEYVWYSDEGLEVEDDKEDKSYRIKIFPDLHSSIYSFALDLNSNVNYELFRHSRADIFARGRTPNGRNMAHNMMWNSSLENFIGLLNYTITFYELQAIDDAILGYVT